jgi:1-deoxy-D-xylulose-5-phosphate synthase
MGGFGTAVIEYAAEIKHHNTDFHVMGIPDRFINHGTQEQLLAELGLDADGLIENIHKILKHENILLVAK